MNFRSCAKGCLSFSLCRNRERPANRKQVAALGAIAVPSPQVTKAGKFSAHPISPESPNTMEKTAAIETNAFNRFPRLASEREVMRATFTG